MPDLGILGSLANIILVPITIISVILNVWQYFDSRKRRALAYEFHPISSPSVIGAGETVSNDLEIRYKGRKIKNLFIMQGKLKNIGNEAITSDEVFDPITFTFDAGTELLGEPQIVYKTAQNLKFSWNFLKIGSGSKPVAVSLDFDLLSEKEELLIEFVWIGLPIPPKVTGHIKSCKIAPIDPSEPTGRVFSTMAVAFFLFVFGLGTLCATVNPFGVADIYRGISAGFVLAGLLGLASNTVVWQLGKYSSRIARNRLKNVAKD